MPMMNGRIMSQKKREVCWECGKERERCKAATVNRHGDVEWICPQCWREWDYDRYLYEHKQVSR